jgi:hypothetical protein
MKYQNINNTLQNDLINDYCKALVTSTNSEGTIREIFLNSHVLCDSYNLVNYFNPIGKEYKVIDRFTGENIFNTSKSIFNPYLFNKLLKDRSVFFDNGSNFGKLNFDLIINSTDFCTLIDIDNNYEYPIEFSGKFLILVQKVFHALVKDCLTLNYSLDQILQNSLFTYKLKDGVLSFTILFREINLLLAFVDKV